MVCTCEEQDRLDFATHPLVETAWLEAYLEDRDLRLVDARWRGDGTSRDLYQRGHLPGALPLDWHHDLSWTDAGGVRDLLLPPARFAAVMEARGIGDHTRVVGWKMHQSELEKWVILRMFRSAFPGNLKIDHHRSPEWSGARHRWHNGGRVVPQRADLRWGALPGRLGARDSA